MKTTLRRILKYTPAVVLGLLVVAWVVSWFRAMAVVIPLVGTPWTIHIGCVTSMLFFGLPEKEGLTASFSWGYTFPLSLETVLGAFISGRREAYSAFPIPFLITLLFPLAVGPFLSFRFRLWHYLAYTALVAVELAYYLRWQG